MSKRLPDFSQFILRYLLSLKALRLYTRFQHLPRIIISAKNLCLLHSCMHKIFCSVRGFLFHHNFRARYRMWKKWIKFNGKIHIRKFSIIIYWYRQVIRYKFTLRRCIKTINLNEIEGFSAWNWVICMIYLLLLPWMWGANALFSPPPRRNVSQKLLLYKSHLPTTQLLTVHRIGAVDDYATMRDAFNKWHFLSELTFPTILSNF